MSVTTASSCCSSTLHFYLSLHRPRRKHVETQKTPRIFLLGTLQSQPGYPAPFSLFSLFFFKKFLSFIMWPLKAVVKRNRLNCCRNRVCGGAWISLGLRTRGAIFKRAQVGKYHLIWEVFPERIPGNQMWSWVWAYLWFRIHSTTTMVMQVVSLLKSECTRSKA